MNSASELKFEIGHVLFIDIVGYSKLLIAQQSNQIQTLREIVRATEQFKKAEAEGKLLRLPTGDGAALVFRNTLEAPVLCVLEISKALKSHPELKVRMGILANANQLIDDLTKRFPQDTVVQTQYLPMARSALALNSGNAKAALDALSAAAPYELGHTNDDFTFALYPVYFRGQAYLAAKNGAAAEAEFQKILDHASIVGNEPIGALAHLGLARAYSLSGNTAKAKIAFQDFFRLWKETDPDVPLLIQAKSEFAKLP
jgi:predicted Zn-dependent protease